MPDFEPEPVILSADGESIFESTDRHLSGMKQGILTFLTVASVVMFSVGLVNLYKLLKNR